MKSPIRRIAAWARRPLLAAASIFRSKPGRSGDRAPDPIRDAALIRRALKGRLSSHLIKDVGGEDG